MATNPPATIRHAAAVSAGAARLSVSTSAIPGYKHLPRVVHLLIHPSLAARLMSLSIRREEKSGLAEPICSRRVWSDGGKCSRGNSCQV